MNRLGWGLAFLLVAVGCGKKKEEPPKTAIDDAKKAACANNLKQLWNMQNNYIIQYGGRQMLFPQETGGAFWLKLSQPSSRLIDESLQGIYACPYKAPRKGETDYRGPASDVNMMRDGDAVGACIGNHPDGSAIIIRKMGDVQEVKEGDPLLKTTKP